MLSAQTESYLYRGTYRDLSAAYKPWERLLKATKTEIASVIRRGGLARKKAAQLKAALHEIKRTRGVLSLRFLHKLSDSEAFEYLDALPGVGIKTAKCVMMYALRRDVFPVDTHVWRVARRLGIAPPVAKPSEAHQRRLEELVPKEIRFHLHVKLISLGQQQCTPYFPKCSKCPLSDLCPSSGKPDKVWNEWSQPNGVWAMGHS
jgi:endonuclease III